MKIVILMNEQSLDALSYEQVDEAIEKKQPHIITNCLDFACFDILEMHGYDVIVQRWDKDLKQHAFIVLSELLENNRPYSDRQIRKAHNIQKMIKAGALYFLPKKGLEEV